MEGTKNCQILVIDDMRELEDMLRLFLSYRREDCVLYARNGVEGLALAEQNPPQLIILDLMMPDLSGYDVFRRLQMMPKLKDVPVILLTVLPPQMVYPEAQELGIAGYVCKPFDFEELLLARDTVLRGEKYYPLPKRKTGSLDRTAQSG